MALNKQLFGAFQAASYNIFLQVFFRLQTFLLNGFILRYISKDVLGIINVRLLLYYSTVLFLSKESFRNTCLSYTKDHNWPQVINLLWLTVPVATACALCFGLVWIHLLEAPGEEYVDQYEWAVVVIGVCCVFEMAAEPLYMVARVFHFNKIRVVNECLSVAARCSCLAFVCFWSPDVAIGGFVLGQVLYSLLWVGGIYLWFIYVLHWRAEWIGQPFPFQRTADFFPHMLQDNAHFSAEQLSLTWSFFKQGFLKQLLTEGERYVMTMFSILSFAEQGVFDVVSNLGSMAARFIFRPVEDSSFQFFSSMVKRGLTLEKHKREDTVLVASVLKNLFRVMIILGLIILAFGYAFAQAVLMLYGGTMFSSGIGIVLLRWHCVYILFLAVNGISECYVLSTMSKPDVDRYNFRMIFFSIGFLFLSWILSSLIGSVGFILANCANMLARIVYSCNYIQNVYSGSAFRPLIGLVPNFVLIAAITVSAIVTALSEAYFCCDKGTTFMMVHFGIGITCLLVVITVIFLKEHDLMNMGRELLHLKKS